MRDIYRAAVELDVNLFSALAVTTKDPTPLSKTELLEWEPMARPVVLDVRFYKADLGGFLASTERLTIARDHNHQLLLVAEGDRATSDEIQEFAAGMQAIEPGTRIKAETIRLDGTA